MTECDPGRQEFTEMGQKAQELPSHHNEKEYGMDICKYFKRATIVQITPQCGAKKSQMLLRHFGDMFAACSFIFIQLLVLTHIPATEANF